MAIELRQQLKLTQHLVMTPQLQQAIRLLQLSRLEMMDMIHQEMEENPALEEIQEASPAEEMDKAQANEREAASDSDVAASEKEVTIEEKINEDIDWSNYIDEYNSTGKASFEFEEKSAPRFEAFLSKKESLTDHLLWQLAMISPTAEEKQIGSLVIGNLNKNGYLDTSVEEIARTNDFPHEEVEQVLFMVQAFDPVGVGARDLRECLLIQAQRLGADNSIVTEIIENHLGNLENKNYNAICKATKADMEDILFAVNLIKGLEPRPGLEFNDENSQYIVPDIYVYKVEDDFVVMLNDDGMPRLRLNSFFRNIVNEDGEVSKGTREYMQEKLNSASWLIKSIHQRQKTIYKVMESILRFQRAFFEKGVTHLKPLVLRDVAEDIEMHESTISRVTTNKYAYTPQGIFELKYFFNSSINRVHGGEAIASASVQETIRRIIENEDPRKPYSDDKISQRLEEMNINIARRTVAKYREMMRILPSNKRRQL